MLRNTFLHLTGIGARKELALWKSGVESWEDYEKYYGNQLELLPFTSMPKSGILSELERSKFALESENADYFAELLPSHEHYRIALTFPKQTVFLDLETTGLSLYYDSITVIGLMVHDKYLFTLAGQEDSALGEIRDILHAAKCLVTFNGTLFDVKFLRKLFPDIRLPKSHVDLRYVAKRSNLAGSQKELELNLEINRPKEFAELRGEMAPILWHRYIRGDIGEGNRLLSYNFLDVLGLRKIFARLVNQKLVQSEVPNAAIRQLSDFAKANAKPQRISKALLKTKYTGSVGPRITIASFIGIDRPALPRVVGIDLTGSEKRPSGWAFISGLNTETRLIASDEELVATTLNSKPDVVSIDSPLSLPAGRMSTSDDDPGRSQYGIMRKCERELKRRGVNVYPCLLPSMQKLTARGILMARRLRAEGVPVIESYPGAAQDILGIPRKRQSLEFLSSGLQEFGLTGSFSGAQVSHDELDAITSALVGIFFWFGRFERLGDEIEDYLIIPDLTIDPSPWIKRLVIGISGPIAAGKTTAGEFLRDKGFIYQRFSLVLKEIMKDRGLELDRKTMQEFGEEISVVPGQSWFCRMVARKAGLQDRIVIDGMRFPEDRAGLVEWFGPGFQHLHIEATAETRESRYVAREGSLEQFRAAVEHPVERNISRLAEMADWVFLNNGTIPELYQRLSALITR